MPRRKKEEVLTLQDKEGEKGCTTIEKSLLYLPKNQEILS